jgi:hypothetical protein
MAGTLGPHSHASRKRFESQPHEGLIHPLPAYLQTGSHSFAVSPVMFDGTIGPLRHHCRP